MAETNGQTAKASENADKNAVKKVVQDATQNASADMGVDTNASTNASVSASAGAKAGANVGVDANADVSTGASAVQSKKSNKAADAEKVASLNPKAVRNELHSTPNHRGRGRTASEKRAAYAEYRATKRKVVDLESRNNKHLVLYPASDFYVNAKKFYVMGGNSAIIYCYEIAIRLKRKAHLRPDMDHGNGDEKFRHGVCYARDVERLIRDLEAIGIKRIPAKKGYEDIIIFKLKREYPNTEIKEMLKAEQKSIDRCNQLLYSQILLPDVHAQILKLNTLAPAKLKRLEPAYRELVGKAIMDDVFTIMNTYSRMAHGDIDVVEGAKKLILMLDSLQNDTKMMMDLQLWDVEFCAKIGTVIMGIKQNLRGKVINKNETNR